MGSTNEGSITPEIRKAVLDQARQEQRNARLKQLAKAREVRAERRRQHPDIMNAQLERARAVRSQKARERKALKNTTPLAASTPSFSAGSVSELLKQLAQAGVSHGQLQGILTGAASPASPAKTSDHSILNAAADEYEKAAAANLQRAMALRQLATQHSE